MTRRVTILGSGTSTGVPVIGCYCSVCTSAEPRNVRTRSSVLLKDGDIPLVIDTGPDFRTQMLRAKIDRLDYVVYTHVHADHCHGFDDLRAYYFHTGKPVACYVPRWYESEFRARFHYAFEPTGYKGTVPQVDLVTYDQGPLRVGPFDLEIVALPHGNVLTAGIKWRRFAYTTDFKGYPDEVVNRWRGALDVLVASGNNFNESHPTHSSVQETVALFQRLAVGRGVVTHLAHDIDYIEHKDRLPRGVDFAYDGMTIDLNP